MTLESLARKGWLVAHKTSRQEINDLFSVAKRDLADCRVSGLSVDWRLNIAYNAAIQCAKAALAVSGYRPSREAQHYRIIQSLKYTINMNSEDITYFDGFRKKRNISDYEKSGLVSEEEAEEMYQFAVELKDRISEWIKINHPEFL